MIGHLYSNVIIASVIVYITISVIYHLSVLRNSNYYFFVFFALAAAWAGFARRRRFTS